MHVSTMSLLLLASVGLGRSFLQPQPVVVRASRKVYNSCTAASSYTTTRRSSASSSTSSSSSSPSSVSSSSPPSSPPPFSTSVTVLFPGQGTQYLGLGVRLASSIPEAARLFDHASSILQYDLLNVCRSGPSSLLDSTAVSQPAIFVSSLCAAASFRSSFPEVDVAVTCAAGLSLGEYTSLCYAGALTFEDGVKLVALRGKAMQEAADLTPGGMIVVYGQTLERAKDLCVAAEEQARGGGVGQDEFLSVANYLGDRNYALSGSSNACLAALKLAKTKDFGFKLAVPLSVAGAFHTRLMAPAVAALAKGLQDVTIHRVPTTRINITVLRNVDGRPYDLSDPSAVKASLLRQIVEPVQWESTMEFIVNNGCEKAIEIGPGKVLAGLMKKHAGSGGRKNNIVVTNLEA